MKPKEWVAFKVPPIITAEVFTAAQAPLARNKALAQRNRKYDYLLMGGRLRCGLRGRAMTGQAPHGRRRYRCSSRNTFADPSKRCKGSLNADDTEARVWQAIDRVLQQPELIAAEVKRQQACADEERAEIIREMSCVEEALARCNREEQRWTHADAGEVINLQALKSDRAEIAVRRQSVLSQRDK